MTEKEELLFSLVIYAILIFIIALFCIIVKNRRSQLAKDNTPRSLTTWERMMLVGVGMML